MVTYSRLPTVATAALMWAMSQSPSIRHVSMDMSNQRQAPGELERELEPCRGAQRRAGGGNAGVAKVGAGSESSAGNLAVAPER
ncbi:hypothetical protein SAMN02745121_02805 [Nannocystis exedens]|uniref:Uncharacterized protein n=1 Tax=Nannocystis exedens TaxID=54 RepID=A0A1I1XER2_9BACT|nr:hypothetical protein NAEX_06554 [Nannocystis exedens]SFE05879.1 hypothetical protein SAMN02745121_02805 [Nannocystis exedens]